VIQGFLETIGVPYTGSGVFASAAGMDKIASKLIFEQNGLDTPPYTIWGVNHPEVTVDEIVKKHSFPCFVKCPQSGSSRLMGRADNRAALEALLEEYRASADDILIETTVRGDEYSCPILEKPDGSIQPLPPILIRPLKSAFFDFEAKYTSGASEEIVPAPCSEELTRRLQQAALVAHRSLGCRGITRTDIIVQDGRLYVLEINTLPGMTSASLVPKAFAAVKGSYAGLLDILIQTAQRGNN
jgi:D-alanine-D-alanine ligase